ncbi:MAG TPA: MauE/DoxX family redox-associated membrane protein [Candidatus Limnocylindria bacterium]|nr:MauE/DoxX family redox-associated membrane protein [Candidatus Limnocylindria bacterium]
MSKAARTSFSRILLLVGRVALAGIFLVAAYAKLKPQGGMAWSAGSVKTSLAMFAMQVDSYQMLSVKAVNFVAHALPPFELFLGLWLLSGIALRFSSLISTLLLGGFFSVMVRTFSLGLEVSCGCFGPGEQIGTKTLLRDGSLLALSLAVCIGAFLIRRESIESGAPVAAVGAPQRAN